MRLLQLTECGDLGEMVYKRKEGMKYRYEKNKAKGDKVLRD
jgi:hypothetical protein